MKLTTLPQFARDAKRFKEIVSILAKYGLAGFLETHEPEFIRNLLNNHKTARTEKISHEARIRMAMTELGPTFIKIGQIMSTREDLVGPALADELAQLQSATPADPPDTVIATFTSELGDSPSSFYNDFDSTALASASIGQIHRATLKDGTPVVVKIQHHGIEKIVERDLNILMGLAELAEKHDAQLRNFQPRKTLAEFRRNLLRELDFRREQRNLNQFANNFVNDTSVKIPAAFPEVSTRRVLTMEMLEGFSIGDQTRLKQLDMDTKDLAEKGANLFLEMIFRDGFYHADPHPGNIWALPDGRIGLLDCGMVGNLDEHSRDDMEEMLMAAVNRDSDRITDYVLRIGTVPQGIDRNALRVDISEFVAEYISSSLKDFDLSGALTGLTTIVRDYHIILPPSISLLLKVLVMLEGTSRQLDRDFNLAELLQPYQVKAIQRKYSPEKMMHRVQRVYRDWDRFLEMLPREFADIVEKVRDGKFDVNLEHRKLDTVVNRLVYGILTAALFLGSCRLIAEEIVPLVKGVSVIGAVGCMLSLILGYRLLKAIKRSGDL